MANHIAMAVLCEPGDRVLIESPTYELLVSTAEYIGLKVSRFERLYDEGFRIDPDRVRRAITPGTKLVVLTNLHNPSSILTDADTLTAIGSVAETAGARILVDEAYLDAAFDIPHQSATGCGDSFVSTSSLTKAYGLSGLRCGWVIAEPGLIEKMWRLKDLFDAIPPHPAERLSVVAFKHLSDIASESRALLAVNHAALTDFLRKESLEVVDNG